MSKLMHSINIVSRCAAIYRADALRDTELSACHTSYILTVCRNPGISQDQLAKNICINRSNVTRQLAYLEEHGFVERRQSESDRRVLLVYPTEKAENVLPTVRKVLEDWSGAVTGDFSADELEQFEDMLERLSVKAKELIDGKGNAQ